MDPENRKKIENFRKALAARQQKKGFLQKAFEKTDRVAERLQGRAFETLSSDTSDVLGPVIGFPVALTKAFGLAAASVPFMAVRRAAVITAAVIKKPLQK